MRVFAFLIFAGLVALVGASALSSGLGSIAQSKIQRMEVLDHA